MEIYGVYENIDDKKTLFTLEGEIGKGRIIFDVKEYILIMVLNKNWEIKQIMVIFGKESEHKQFMKNIYGRALTYISKELKKIVQKKKMINYKKDEIFIYDDRDFVKQEFFNNNKNLKNNYKIKNIENNENKKNREQKIFIKLIRMKIMKI